MMCGLFSGLKVNWLTQPASEVLFAPQAGIFLSYWEVIMCPTYEIHIICVLASFAILRASRGTI